MLQGELIICFSTMNWDFLWTRKQRFMDMLAAKGNTVVYVEPVASFVSKVLRSEEKSQASFWGKSRKVKENLYVLTPPLLLPGQCRIPYVSKINQIYVTGFVKRFLNQMNFYSQPIVWNYSICTENIIGNLNAKFILYECVDSTADYPKVNKKVVLDMEEKVMKQCNVIFATARGLVKNLSLQHDKVFYAPNGVNYKHFALAQDPATEIPLELINCKRPIIGFVGGIYEWIDLDLIYSMAQLRHDWTIVMVGPVGKRVDIQQLKTMTNIIITGSKSLTELPGILKSFDVCINPFKQNKLSKHVNPLKVYEYLAAGKPVVSTEMEELFKLKEVISFVSTAQKFIDEIEKILAKEDSDCVKLRQSLICQYDWENLLSDVCNKIGIEMGGRE
jgi:glycosyltransferase involved in cell wall biosynthesis